jgi:hypothetical protein
MSAERAVNPHHDTSISGAVPADESRRRKSGSEQRQKRCRITFRLTPGEYGSVQTAADRAGVTLGTFIRDCVLHSPETRRRHRPSVEVQAVARLQGEVNRIGCNLHQLLKRVNFGETPMVNELRSALTGYGDVIAAIMKTLGREAP